MKLTVSILRPRISWNRTKGEKPYRLLHDSLKRAAKRGSKFVPQQGTLVYYQTHEDILVLNRIRFAEEIRSASGLNVPKKESRLQQK
jgi:non-homologous end joining protein Ku